MYLEKPKRLVCWDDGVSRCVNIYEIELATRFKYKSGLIYILFYLHV